MLKVSQNLLEPKGKKSPHGACGGFAALFTPHTRLPGAELRACIPVGLLSLGAWMDV